MVINIFMFYNKPDEFSRKSLFNKENWKMCNYE